MIYYKVCYKEYGQNLKVVYSSSVATGRYKKRYRLNRETRERKGTLGLFAFGGIREAIYFRDNLNVIYSTILQGEGIEKEEQSYWISSIPGELGCFYRMIHQYGRITNYSYVMPATCGTVLLSSFTPLEIVG